MAKLADAYRQRNQLTALTVDCSDSGTENFLLNLVTVSAKNTATWLHWRDFCQSETRPSSQRSCSVVVHDFMSEAEAGGSRREATER